jgi:hypothetical protein
MPQYSGPVGPGPLDPYYTSNEYEKEQAALKAAAEQQAQQTAVKKGEVGPKTVNPLQPIGQALSTDYGPNIYGAIDTAAGALGLQTNLKKQYEQGQKQAKPNKAQAAINKDKGFGAEAVRTVTNLGVGSVESMLDTADLIGDVIKVGASKLTKAPVKPTENPWSDRYTAAAYSFGLQKPKTQLGQTALRLGELIVLTRAAAKALPKSLIQLGTKGVGLRGAIASGLVPGAVSDFILTKKDDGNFSEMIQNFVPKDNPMHDSLFFALATDRTDDVFTTKLKGTLEGGVFNSIVDGFGWMIYGRKVAQAALKAGATKEQALAQGLEAGNQAMKEADKANTKNIAKEADRHGEANQLELEDLLNVERNLMDQEKALKAAGVPDDAPQAVALKETLADARKALAETDERIVNGYYPNDAERNLPQDAAATIKEGSPVSAIADQHELIRGTGIKIDATDNVRGSTHMMTDAQFRIQNIKGSAEELIRNVSTRFELQDAARASRDSVDAIVKSAAEELDNFRSALGGDVSNDKLLDMMKQSELIDPENTTGRLLSKKGILVTKALVRDTALQINELATNAAAMREAGELTGNSFDRIVDRLVTLLDLHKYTAYKTGFTLQIFKSAIGLGADSLDEAASAAKAELSSGEIRDWATKIKNLQRSSDPKAADEMDALIRSMMLAGGDPSKTVKFWNAARGVGFKQAITGMYQSMLSGPITHLRNTFGNSYSLLERPFSTYLQGVVGGDKALRASAVSGIHGMATGIQDAWQVALTTLRTGDSVNFNHKFVVEDFETRALLEQINLAARTDSEKIAAGFLESSYHFQNNPWLSWPSRSLMAADDFFKSMSARYRMNSKAMYEAISHSAEDADVDMLFNKYIENYSKGIDPQTGRIVDKDLLDYAERITFQQDPGSFMNTFANMLDQSPGGIGKLFIPFVRTPANLFGYGLEHVPFIHKAIRSLGDTLDAAEKSGDMLLAAEIRGRQATGAMLTGTMLTMALMTDVTGNLPFDPKERAAWEEEGRPPMSIKVGSKWVSYGALEPVNSMLSIVADTVRLAKIGGADAASNVMRQLAYSFMAAYTDKSFLAGVSAIGQMLDPKSMQNPNMMNFVLNTANNFVPYAGARRSLSNALDPYLKETRGELDRMLIAAAPGYGRDVPSVTSWITGKKLNSIAGGLYNAVSPIRIQDVNDNYVAKTLIEIGYPSNVIIKTGLNGIRLEPEQRERLSEILFKSGLPKKLDNLFHDKGWQTMAKQWKGRTVTTDMLMGELENAPPHIKEVRSIIGAYKKQALNTLFQEDPKYRAQVFQSRDEQIRAYKGDFSVKKTEEFLQFANAPKPTNFGNPK